MQLSSETYMKAAEGKSPVGSGQSIETVASGSSISTLASSTDLAYINANEIQANSPCTPGSQTDFHRTPLSTSHRTPLSTKARPFVSSQNYNWKQVPVHYSSYKTYTAYPTESARLPTYASQQESSLYNELAQEEVYLYNDTLEKPAYNEELQEQVYLAEAQTKLSGKEQPLSEEVTTTDTEKKDSPRSPSPPPVANRKSAKKDRLRTCMFSEPLPVKYTFIHYHDANEEEDAEKLPMFSTRQTSRARSAPRVLTQNDFSGHSFSRGMAKVHLRSNCQPCAYFHNKNDGCRRGLDCKFCHLCPADELKKRKKMKIKALKERFSTASVENAAVEKNAEVATTAPVASTEVEESAVTD